MKGDKNVNYMDRIRYRSFLKVRGDNSLRVTIRWMYARATWLDVNIIFLREKACVNYLQTIRWEVARQPYFLANPLRPLKATGDNALLFLYINTSKGENVKINRSRNAAWVRWLASHCMNVPFSLFPNRKELRSSLRTALIGYRFRWKSLCECPSQSDSFGADEIPCGEAIQVSRWNIIFPYTLNKWTYRTKSRGVR